MVLPINQGLYHRGLDCLTLLAKHAQLFSTCPAFAGAQQHLATFFSSQTALSAEDGVSAGHPINIKLQAYYENLEKLTRQDYWSDLRQNNPPLDQTSTERLTELEQYYLSIPSGMTFSLSIPQLLDEANNLYTAIRTLAEIAQFYYLNIRIQHITKQTKKELENIFFLLNEFIYSEFTGIAKYLLWRIKPTIKEKNINAFIDPLPYAIKALEACNIHDHNLQRYSVKNRNQAIEVNYGDVVTVIHRYAAGEIYLNLCAAIHRPNTTCIQLKRDWINPSHRCMVYPTIFAADVVLSPPWFPWINQGSYIRHVFFRDSAPLFIQMNGLMQEMYRLRRRHQVAPTTWIADTQDLIKAIRALDTLIDTQARFTQQLFLKGEGGWFDKIFRRKTLRFQGAWAQEFSRINQRIVADKIESLSRLIDTCIEQVYEQYIQQNSNVVVLQNTITEVGTLLNQWPLESLMEAQRDQVNRMKEKLLEVHDLAGALSPNNTILNTEASLINLNQIDIHKLKYLEQCVKKYCKKKLIAFYDSTIDVELDNLEQFLTTIFKQNLDPQVDSKYKSKLEKIKTRFMCAKEVYANLANNDMQQSSCSTSSSSGIDQDKIETIRGIADFYSATIFKHLFLGIPYRHTTLCQIRDYLHDIKILLQPSLSSANVRQVSLQIELQVNKSIEALIAIETPSTTLQKLTEKYFEAGDFELLNCALSFLLLRSHENAEEYLPQRTIIDTYNYLNTNLYEIKNKYCQPNTLADDFEINNCHYRQKQIGDMLTKVDEVLKITQYSAVPLLRHQWDRIIIETNSNQALQENCYTYFNQNTSSCVGDRLGNSESRLQQYR